jgi:hypothetical protein
MEHIVFAVATDGLAGAPSGKLAGRVALPVHFLPPDLGDLDSAVPFRNRAERSTRFDGLQLLRIANQNDFGSGIIRCGQHPLHLARADHSGFVDDKHIAGCQKFPALAPLMFKTGNRARRD